jgi:hypothetical protein
MIRRGFHEEGDTIDVMSREGLALAVLTFCKQETTKTIRLHSLEDDISIAHEKSFGGLVQPCGLPVSPKITHLIRLSEMVFHFFIPAAPRVVFHF